MSLPPVPLHTFSLAHLHGHLRSHILLYFTPVQGTSHPPHNLLDDIYISHNCSDRSSSGLRFVTRLSCTPSNLCPRDILQKACGLWKYVSLFPLSSPPLSLPLPSLTFIFFSEMSLNPQLQIEYEVISLHHISTGGCSDRYAPAICNSLNHQDLRCTGSQNFSSYQQTHQSR